MTPPAVLALDAALAGLTIGLVAALLWTPDRARAVVLFIAFGGVVTLTWVRLRAPDVALAEAAIGAALTGGLMLRACRSLPTPTPTPTEPPGAGLRLLAGLISAGTFATLAWALLSVGWEARPSLAAPVFDRLGESGVTNPVTAVLMNFRAYDTLLEVAVVLTAAIGIWMLDEPPSAPAPLRADPQFLAAARLLVPLSCILAGYLLWLGSFAPGGAFQAGAVLSASFVLLLLSGVPWAPGRADGIGLRLLLVSGLVTFIAVSTGVTLAGGALLQYPAGQAKALILLTEAALTLSVALTLVVLFLGAHPPESGRPAP